MRRTTQVLAVTALVASFLLAQTAWAQDKPNVVLMVMDNHGWGLRYLRESGARSTLEGDTFLLTVTFPVPSVPLQ